MVFTAIHSKYFAYELTKRCPSDSVEKLAATLSEAQVDLNPHQVEAALFAFRSPLSKGAILADEVGLGKTIEAGIVLSQMWAERKRRILIILPANLRKQWNIELEEKFFLPSVILETASFNQEIKKGNLNPFHQDGIVICSYNFARAKEVYISAIQWDLIVIDEAHRLRNVYKPSNKIGNSIKNASSQSRKLLLTATPLQNSLLELFGLVSIIDDYAFGDVKSFKNQFARLTNEDNFTDLKERLKPLCIRTLRKQVLEYVKYTNRLAMTQEFYPTEDEQRLYDLVSDYLQKPNLFALPPSQRQMMTLILRRLLASSTYAISGTLQGLADKLQAAVNAQVESSGLIEQTLASDFEMLPEYKEEWTDEDKPDEPDRKYTPEEIQQIREEIASLKSFHNLAKSIIKNSKGTVLLTAIQNGFKLAEDKGGKRKAVIFTESRRTQEYLLRILEETEFKGKLVLFNGSNSDPLSKEIYKKWHNRHASSGRATGSKTADLRMALVDYFRDEAMIMIATEAAAEGINLQFCSLVVNYDLPWNPQRIEQRIGRCHRYGQKHDVVVVNFLNKKNAADQRVFQLLSEKFKLFEGVFGASDEVLGSLESGIDFEKRIAHIYQTCRTEQDIQASFDALQHEMETQIDEKMGITRQKLLENFDEEVHEKLRINLVESRQYLTRYERWLWEITQYYLEPYARFDHSKNSFYLEKNPFPNEKIHPGPYRMGKDVDDVNLYRAGHPLAQRIISKCKQAEIPDQEVIFNYSEAPQKISILAPLIGKSGWLEALNLTIHSFEAEDHVIFSGVTDDGEMLDAEQCSRLFSLSAVIKSHNQRLDASTEKILTAGFESTRTGIMELNSLRSARYFDDEMIKLDKWADDMKNSLEIELKNLDKEIKFLKTESKKLAVLEDKVKAQRHIKELEKKRNELRMNLYQSQDEVDARKEELLAKIEKRMRQQIEIMRIFSIRWKLL